MQFLALIGPDVLASQGRSQWATTPCPAVFLSYCLHFTQAKVSRAPARPLIKIIYNLDPFLVPSTQTWGLSSMPSRISFLNHSLAQKKKGVGPFDLR